MGDETPIDYLHRDERYVEKLATPDVTIADMIGDIVTISSDKFGALANRVRLSPDCPRWTYGASHLMRDLARANLI